MKIVFCSSEVTPFAKTGGMADVCYALPVALEALGLEVCIFMPEYRGVRDTPFGFEEFRPDCGRATIGKNIPVYFIRHDDYFHRDHLYGDAQGDYGDNLARFHYFCDKVLHVLRAESMDFDILHCHDWQASLIPAAVRHRFPDDPFLKEKKTILTIHNLAYQGVFPADQFGVLGFDRELFQSKLFEFYGQLNLLKVGILTSDMITTVSPRYAREIQTPTFGCGLAGVLNSRREDIAGILNGIDRQVWNPAADSLIPRSYTVDSIDGKKANKTALQKACGLPAGEDFPLFGFVGRLSSQKGIDLLIESMYKIGGMNIQLVVLGRGDKRYEDLLQNFAARYPDKISVQIQFDEKTAHRIYAGSDIFLMPSHYEPCGLSQMISLAYGTIPLVFETGGLADTIRSYREGGNGFVFREYTRDAFMGILQEAVDVYHNKGTFAPLMHKAMAYDFTWENSARSYRDLYERCLVHA